MRGDFAKQSTGFGMTLRSLPEACNFDFFTRSSAGMTLAHQRTGNCLPGLLPLLLDCFASLATTKNGRNLWRLVQLMRSSSLSPLTE